MNKVITDGLVLMPPPFVDGLTTWSSGDGTPGSDSYAGSGNGVFVPADQNFGGCLEILKTQATTRLRYMGQTPILPGCYLRVTVRVKAVSGALPSVRIAGWPGRANGTKLTGVTETAPPVPLTGYGQVVELSAIVGTGPRGGVSLVWNGADYGHFGIDLTGPNGGIVRVDDIVIEDVTGVYLRDMVGFVDVRDYGAVGNGVTDDAQAFRDADADADGRIVLISEGTYSLGDNVTFQNRVHFQGQVTQGPQFRLVFQKNFDYATYYDAFRDEDIAFRKAFQALLNFSDHESLNLNGRRITLTGPIDMAAAVNNKPRFEERRVIRNGQFETVPGPAWDTEVVTSQASYAVSNARRLDNVANVQNIKVGMLVEGNGVGREVYVQSVNTAANRLSLSRPLFDAEGNQTFTFRRFKYMLDFTGFEKFSAVEFEDIDFRMQGLCSGMVLATDGHSIRIRDCQFNRPRDRGITSPGDGCTGLDIFNCIFNSDEQALPSQNRSSLCFNINRNDATVRNNRAARFRHFGFLAGNGNMITGNHFFMGDDEPNGLRQAGLVLTSHNCASTITANYIDNCFIEVTNEHDPTPDAGVEYTFGGLSITGNIFIASNTAPWFNFIVVTPYGQDHAIREFSVTGNVFRTYGSSIDRVERVDTSYADIDRNMVRNLAFSNNAFNGITQPTRNPYIDIHNQQTAASVWVIDTGAFLPFEGWTRTIESIQPVHAITDAANQPVWAMPYVQPVNTPNTNQFRLVWPEPVKGRIRFSVRMDNPA